MDYFDFLIHSVEQNYEAENYHFAVVALHMIYNKADVSLVLISAK